MEKLICMVTGATDGIGKAVAKAIAQRGDTLLIVGRDSNKTETVLKEIVDSSSNTDVEYFITDLSSQKQVRTLSDLLQSKYPKLDVLVNNAGSVFMSRRESEDGIEMTFALNHLSYFLLSNLLLPLLKESTAGKIINVSSSAHVRSYLDFSDLQFNTNYNVIRAYGRSKLANLLLTYQMAKNVREMDVTVNAVHPGVVSTNLLNSNNKSWFAKILNLGLKFRGIKSDVSAGHILKMFTEEEFHNVNGKYFVDGRIIASAPQSYIEEDARELWDISNSLTGHNFPRV